MADIDFLSVHAEGSPDKPALIHGGSNEVVDFSTLDRRANRAANVFSGLGCEPEDRAGIMSFNSIAGFEISNGLRRVSLVAVPVNYRLRGSEVAYVLNDSGARIVCADSDHVDVVDAARPEVTGERHYIATGDRRPDGWLSYAELMDAAPDHAPESRNTSGGLVTTTFMAPTLLKRLVDAQERKPRDTSLLRALILGAAPCPHALKVRAEAVFGQVLWEFYGATETGINTVLRPEDQLRKPGSCGTALPGQEIRLVRADGAEAAVGEPGELMVRSNWLAEDFNRPDATRGSLHKGFFSVGDVAYRDQDGYFYICDRRIDMIISGGVNIYPAEIEAVLHAHPAVMDAAVIGVPDDQWGESVKAVVELRGGMEVTADALIAFCGDRLAGFKKPRSIDFVDELPRDAAGKLLKRKLRDPYWAGAGRTI